MCVSVGTSHAALLSEGGQFRNVVGWSRWGKAGTEVCIVGKVVCDARQVRQVGGHVNLRYLTQVWHVEVRLRCLVERKCHPENSFCTFLPRRAPTCLSNCSLLVIDNGASNGFSSFSVSNAVCVFVTAPARGSRSTYFLYLAKHTKGSIRRKYFIKRQQQLCPPVHRMGTRTCVCACVDSQVLCRIKEQEGADR